MAINRPFGTLRYGRYGYQTMPAAVEAGALGVVSFTGRSAAYVVQWADRMAAEGQLVFAAAGGITQSQLHRVASRAGLAFAAAGSVQIIHGIAAASGSLAFDATAFGVRVVQGFGIGTLELFGVGALVTSWDRVHVCGAGAWTGEDVPSAPVWTPPGACGGGGWSTSPAGGGVWQPPETCGEGAWRKAA
jgi:hypothetical protein